MKVPNSFTGEQVIAIIIATCALTVVVFLLGYTIGKEVIQ